MWVFGYGSLIWKADFPYEKKLVGYIKGYVRRFYQKSTDHRGVPDRPGRVVTLLASQNPDDEVWGIAYNVSPENVDTVVNYLDFREKGGYERKTILFHPYISDNSCKARTEQNKPIQMEEPFYLTIYIGGENNPNYAGIENIDTIAKQIIISHGPSGSNVEYLYELASAMRKIAPGIYDEHLFSLETEVKKLLENVDGKTQEESNQNNTEKNTRSKS